MQHHRYTNGWSYSYIVDVQEHTPIITGFLDRQYDFIIPVNYNGRQVDLQPLHNQKSVTIIEDSCKSLFSKDYLNSKFSGMNGRFGCFSLGMISILPGIYGGIVSTENESDYQALSAIKWHGVSYNDGDETYDFRSFNFKSSNVHAAIALGMLSSLDERLSKLRTIYTMYEDGLHGLENTRLLPVDINNGELPLLIDLVCSNRRSHTNTLMLSGIPTCNYHNH